MMPVWLERQLRVLSILVIAGAAGFLLYLLRVVLTPIFFGFVIAYALDPVIDQLERWRIHRTAGIVLVLMGLLAVGVVFAFLIVPEIVNELRDVVAILPRKFVQFREAAAPWIERTLHVQMPRTLQQALARFGDQLEALAPKILGPATAVVAQAFSSTFALLAILLNLLLVPIFTFYMLRDFDKLVAWIGSLLPRAWYGTVASVFAEIDETLASFFRGQLIVIGILSVLYSVGLSIVGIRLAVGIGILTGVLQLIPYFGWGVGLSLSILMALFDYHGPGKIIAVLSLYVGLQLADSFFITPRVVGGKVGIPPIWVIVALMTGGQLFGFFGVLLAVPAASVLKILMRRALSAYQRSAAFTRGGVAEKGASP